MTKEQNLSLLKLSVKNGGFARQEKTIDIKCLERIQPYLSSERGEILLSFWVEEPRFGGELSLQLEVRGELDLLCNRCLDGYLHPVNLSQTLCILDGKAKNKAGGSEFDSVYTDERGELDLIEILTDELILSLPFAHKGPCQNTVYQKYVYNAALASN